MKLSTTSVTGKTFLMEIKAMHALAHDNVNAFIGICIDLPAAGEAYVLMSYATRGSLADVLADEELKLTHDFKLSIINDIACGMRALHNSTVGESNWLVLHLNI